jgi:hypothetical protein
MNPPRLIGDRRSGRFLMQVMWPSFMVAVVAEGLLFSLIDPLEIGFVSRHLGDSREAAYTIGFFVFWALLMAASTLTWILTNTPPPKPPGIHECARRHEDESLIER